MVGCPVIRRARPAKRPPSALVGGRIFVQRDSSRPSDVCLTGAGDCGPIACAVQTFSTMPCVRSKPDESAGCGCEVPLPSRLVRLRRCGCGCGCGAWSRIWGYHQHTRLTATARERTSRIGRSPLERYRGSPKSILPTVHLRHPPYDLSDNLAVEAHPAAASPNQCRPQDYSTTYARFTTYGSGG